MRAASSRNTSLLGFASPTGAIAGLLSAGLAATLYASHCTDDSPLFVATWYTIAALVVAGLGAGIGARVLRY